MATLLIIIGSILIIWAIVDYFKAKKKKEAANFFAQTTFKSNDGTLIDYSQILSEDVIQILNASFILITEIFENFASYFSLYTPFRLKINKMNKSSRSLMFEFAYILQKKQGKKLTAEDIGNNSSFATKLSCMGFAVACYYMLDIDSVRPKTKFGSDIKKIINLVDDEKIKSFQSSEDLKNFLLTELITCDTNEFYSLITDNKSENHMESFEDKKRI